MSQSNLLELAKQGNVEALTTLLNRSFQPKGITAKATLKDSCLQIVLESAQVPDQQALVAFMRKSLTSLGAESISKVKVYGRQTEEEFPAWNQEFELVTQTLPLANSTTQSVTSPATQNKQSSPKKVAKTNNVKLTTKSKTQIKTQTYDNQILEWVNLSAKPFIVSASSKILHLPIFVKYGAIAVCLLLLSIKVINIINQSQPISGKMYIVLGRGAASIPDNNIRVVKCEKRSDKCQKIEEWLSKLTIEDASIGTSYVKLDFLTKWGDILMLDDPKNIDFKNLTYMQTDFNGNFSGKCGAPSCFLIAQGKAGLANAFWVVKVKPGENIKLSDDTAIFTYNEEL